jgi:peptide/nickel transport system substrate-binding protein
VSSTGNYWQQAMAVRSGRRRILRAGAVGVAGLGAAWLAACGGGSSNKSSNQGQAQTTAAPGVQPTQQTALKDQGTPKPGGIVTWREVGNSPLDPFNNPTYRAQDLAGFTYSRMLKFKTGPKPDTAYNYEVEGDLAASYEIPGDGTQLTFKIQPNAKFINKPPVNGHAVTSEDVKMSLDRFRNAPKNTNKSAFGTPDNQIVASVETPDPQTVVVKLGKPYAPILNLFANPQYLWIFPKEVDSGFDPAKEQIGSGPFMLDQVQPDVSVTMKKNPDYYVKGKPYIDGVVQAIIPDTAQQIAQYQAGKLDWTGIPAQNKADVQKSKPDSQIITYIPTTYTFISPQQRGSSPFKDVRVRRAISLAIDRKSWLDLLYEGQGSAYLNAVPASMGKWWLDPQGNDAGSGAQWFKHDPKQARDLLKAAGQENLQLRFIYANNAYGDIFNQGADSTASMLKDAGFNPTIVTQDYLREYIDANGTFFGNYEGVFYGLQTPFTDPHDYLFSMNHPKSARNHAGIDDPKLTQMIDDEERTLDENQRVQKVKDIQKYWMDQMYYIPIAVGYAYLFQQPWMRHLYYSSTYGFGVESHLDCWIDKG